MASAASCLLLCLCVSALPNPTWSFVEELNDSFMESRGKDDIWLIKFYAPWCLFCKKLDPLWHQIGSELRSLGSPVQVGKVDATISTAMVKEFKVRTYPAIIMLKNEQKYNYPGPKTKDSIMDFTYRVSGPSVKSLSSPKLVDHALSRHSVMFLFIGATSDLKRNFSDAAQELIIHTNFYSTSREHLPKWVSVSSFPAVLVFKDGTYFPYSPESGLDLKTWINKERFPSFSKLDSYSLYALGDSGQLVLVAVLGNSRSEQSLRFKALVQKISSESRSQYSDFYFGFLDETDFISGLMMSDDVTVPLLIVLNLTSDAYFLPPVTVETEQDLRHFLDAVVGGTLQALGGNSLLQQIRRIHYDLKTSLTPAMQEAPVLMGLLLAIPSALILSVILLCIRMRPMFGDSDDQAAPAVSRRMQQRHKHRKSD